MGDRHRGGKEVAKVHQGDLLRVAASAARLQVLQARATHCQRLLADQVGGRNVIRAVAHDAGGAKIKIRSHLKFYIKFSSMISP